MVTCVYLYICTGNVFSGRIAFTRDASWFIYLVGTLLPVSLYFSLAMTISDVLRLLFPGGRRESSSFLPYRRHSDREWLLCLSRSAPSFVPSSMLSFARTVRTNFLGHFENRVHVGTRAVECDRIVHRTFRMCSNLQASKKYFTLYTCKV